MSQDPAECRFCCSGSKECGGLLQSLGDDTGTVGNVLDSLAVHLGLQAQLVRAGGLVAFAEVGVLAPLVNAKSAGRVGDVEEREVFADPGVSLLAAGDEVHGVGSGERKGLVVGLEEVLALAHGDVLVGSGDATTHGWVLSCAFASDQVVVCIVGDVIGATRSVDLEQVDAAAVGRNLDAHLVAVNGAGPVGNAVGVNLAAKDTNRRRVHVVGSDGDGVALGGNGESSGASREGCDGGNGEEHFE